MKTAKIVASANKSGEKSATAQYHLQEKQRRRKRTVISNSQTKKRRKRTKGISLQEKQKEKERNNRKIKCGKKETKTGIPTTGI